MKTAYFLKPSRKLLFLMAMSAGISALPQQMMATEIIQANQQSSIIKGKVVDATGEPIIGATIKVKGSTAATITDMDGAFAIKARKNEQLVISYVGCQAETVSVGNGNLVITLKDDATQLNDVVVVGYGTMRKKDLTGSVVL